MVEAWRLNKQSLYDAVPADVQLHVFCVFVDKVEPEYETVRVAMVEGMEKLKKPSLPQ
jgi:hypothetical protein